MASNASRTMIAALQVSLDGLTQGADGNKDWVDSWAEALGLIPNVDMFVLGGRMYPDYGEYWKAIHDHPDRLVPFAERLPSKTEIEYARLAARTPHVVLSTTQKSVSWPASARVVRDIAELRALKAEPGKNTYVVGGATFVASLLDEGLIDELRLIVHPVALGKGQALFGGLKKRLELELVDARAVESGKLIVTYRVPRHER